MVKTCEGHSKKCHHNSYEGGNPTTHYTLSHAKSCEKAKKVELVKATGSSTPLTL